MSLVNTRYTVNGTGVWGTVMDGQQADKIMVGLDCEESLILSRGVYAPYDPVYLRIKL